MEGPVPPGPRDAVERVPPIPGAVEGVPPCPHGAFEGAKRLDLASSAGAFGPPHCCRRPTAPGLSSTDDRILWGPDDIHRWRPQFHPGPGLMYPKRRPQPEGSKASPAELLVPCSRQGGRGQAENRNSPPVRWFPSKRWNSLFEPPPTFTGFVPVRAAGTLREKGFVGLPSGERSKSDARPSPWFPEKRCRGGQSML